MFPVPRSMKVLLIIFFSGAAQVLAQQEVGYSERFALAEDRRAVLQELIPGTEEYFYYHCLHFQNEGQFANAQAMLDAWRTQLGESAKNRSMLTRQRLLTYDENPQETLDYLKRELSINLQHSRPSRDRAAQLANSLDNTRLQTNSLLQSVVARDKSLGQLEQAGLWLLIEEQLSVDQLRALLGRLERADLPGVVARIAEELKLKDTKGFGWANIHQRLTLEQLEQLQQTVPTLLGHEAFVRAYTARLAPPEGQTLSDKDTLREYLDRLLAWSNRLPESQNSFKALVLGNLLRLDMSEGIYNRQRFLAYLQLPRSAPYYNTTRFERQRVSLAELNYSMQPQAALQPIADDTTLVRRYLEQFLKSQDDLSEFAQFLDRDYLRRVRAETSILYGLGDATTAYAQLTPGEQKEIKERVEVRFAPQNQTQLSPTDAVVLDVEIKNAPQLIVKIYEINTLNHYRNHPQAPGTDLDLDGLVANTQRTIEFSHASQLRHDEKIPLPELAGRGIWVVDLLGGGIRSRALIQKGTLVALERMGDAGHVFRIVDEAGHPQPQAHIELNSKSFMPDKTGQIVVPYAETQTTRQLLLVDQDLTAQQVLAHFNESYQLQAGFLVDRQSLVAGLQATIAIRTRLECNGRATSIELLESPQLTVRATDLDGIATTQTTSLDDLSDGDEVLHQFLVPQRLAQLQFVLEGKVRNVSRGELQTVRSEYSLACNAICKTEQIADFYLVPTPNAFKLHVIGRNGEAIPSLPVNLAIKLNAFKAEQRFTLATDERGHIDLGKLAEVDSIVATANGIRSVAFLPKMFHRRWPVSVVVPMSNDLVLPLGKSTVANSSFRLFEIRNNTTYRDASRHIELQPGRLIISDWQAGEYILHDYEGQQRLRIFVAAGEEHHGFVVGKHQIAQTNNPPAITIQSAEIDDGQLKIRVAGADAMTRVHVIADAFMPSSDQAEHFQFPFPTSSVGRWQPARNHFVDSLRLDEEYQYILDRQSAKKFPGNMLVQPTLLIHPWELSVAESTTRQAAAGDALPASPAPDLNSRMSRGEAEAQMAISSPDWKCFDFLASGAVIAGNLGLANGSVSIPLEALRNSSHVTVVAVHPTTVDSRQVVVPNHQLSSRDQRLESAFGSDQHLVQTHTVEVLQAGTVRELGDPRSKRLQTFTSIADVFQLYATILNNPEWEKFRFVGNWHELSPEAQLAAYDEMACHELNVFLYHKDRPFFERVIRPFLTQKMDKQLVDRWLLEEPIDQYANLWQLDRLNTLERVLLASRVPQAEATVQRWLNEYLEANKLDENLRNQRFEIALRGSLLGSSGGRTLEELSAAGGGFGGSMNFDGARLGESLAESDPRMPPTARAMRAQANAKASRDAVPEALTAQFDDNFFGSDRKMLGLPSNRFFQSLKPTRVWAETHYHHVKLEDQLPSLIPANPFWQEYLTNEADTFLPMNLDLACSNVSEALLALAVVDLPFEPKGSKLDIENGQIVLRSETPGIVYLESVQPTPENAQSNEAARILVGQEIYLSNPGDRQQDVSPLGNSPLLKGTAYVARVVVTNTSNQQQQVYVLTQLPQGTIPLQGNQQTRSTPLKLNAYSTAQVEYRFYFPNSGSFDHYGAQVNDAEGTLASAAHRTIRVLDAPESVDENTWSYVADWGTNGQVIDYLTQANLQQLDLSRIAFRMQDTDFYKSVIELLASAGRFDATLWAYSLQHADPARIEQFLQQRADLIAQLGPVLRSPLLTLNPQQQHSYQHLDFNPLVVARFHQLGTQRVILNPRLHGHYHDLMNVISHNSKLMDDQRMQVCYYMILQNRIEEALTWFSQVTEQRARASMQYAYFDAYLDFYRGEYDHAREVAQRFANYPVPRWNSMFRQVLEQIAAREAILAGNSLPPLDENEPQLDPTQKLLAGTRESQQTVAAAVSPALSLQNRGEKAVVNYQNLESLQVNYYLMDIELLFSREPFVSQGDGRVPVIEPNQTQKLELPTKTGSAEIPIPQEVRNRNVLVEVTAAGLSSSLVVTANSLNARLLPSQGQIHVQSRLDSSPATGAYVKVYARHADGSVRFFKDGYTDLRGYFDYASLSTADLDTTQRLAILVMDQQLGTVVLETIPPTR